MTDYEKRIKELEKKVEELEKKINEDKNEIEKLIASNNALNKRIESLLNLVLKNNINLEENNEQKIDIETIKDTNDAISELDSEVEEDLKNKDNHVTLEDDNNKNEEDVVGINNPVVRKSLEEKYNLEHNNITQLDEDDDFSLNSTENEYLGSRVNLSSTIYPSIQSNELASHQQEEKQKTDIDYNKTKGKKSSKLKNIRKSFNWEKIKSGIKKHWKIVVAATLAATATVSALVSGVTNNNKSIDEDNTSIIQENNTDFPSKNAANEFGVNTDDILNNFNLDNEQRQVQDESSTNVTNEETADHETNENEEKNTNKTTDDNYSIGQEVKFTGDYIYQTSKDASNETNKLRPDYPNDDKRSISAIQMVSPDGTQHVTITDNNKEEQDLLESMGWTVESYNLSNDNENIKYEGWRNNGDLEVSNGNHR